jgi:hypothetical protein
LKVYDYVIEIVLEYTDAGKNHQGFGFNSFYGYDFGLLYGIFGADILAYLLDQAWVPAATVAPFRPLLFLKRLSVLEQTAKDLRDGAKTPIWLSETAHYFRPGMGASLKCFNEEAHRPPLDRILGAFRRFGEEGLSLRMEDKGPKAYIHIFDPHGYDGGPEVEAFVAGRTSTPEERALDESPQPPPVGQWES